MTEDGQDPIDLAQRRDQTFGGCTIMISRDIAVSISAAVAAKLRETGHRIVVMDGVSFRETLSLNAAEITAALGRHIEPTRRVEPVITYERGKQKAQWKRERNRGR